MSDAEAFELVCARLEEKTSLERLAARGTLRIVVKEAGLDSRNVTSQQMSVVVSQLLAAQLESRGVESAGTVCAALQAELEARGSEGGAGGETPESIFGRLGG